MILVDPPKHSFYRRLVGNLFTPKRAEGWRDSIRDIVAGILDEASERTSCDLVEDIAGKLPSYVIAELLGIPRSEGARLYQLTETMHGAPDVVSDEQRFGAMRESPATARASARRSSPIRPTTSPAAWSPPRSTAARSPSRSSRRSSCC
jgi:cytochrome P450